MTMFDPNAPIKYGKSARNYVKDYFPLLRTNPEFIQTVHNETLARVMEDKEPPFQPVETMPPAYYIQVRDVQSAVLTFTGLLADDDKEDYDV